jgi:hypothetical protein
VCIGTVHRHKVENSTIRLGIVEVKLKTSIKPRGTLTNTCRSNRGLSGPTDSEDLINLVVFTGKCLAGNAGETRVTR